MCKQTEEKVFNLKDKVTIKLGICDSIIEKSNILLFGNIIGLFGYYNENNTVFDYNRTDISNIDFQNNIIFLHNAIKAGCMFTIIGDYNLKLYIDSIKENIRYNFKTNKKFKNIINNLDYQFNFITTYNKTDYEVILNYLKENNMKFDYIVGNPPFGSTGGDTLHLKCIDKIYDLFNKKMIVIMPFGFVTKDTKSFKNYQIKFAPKLQYVKEISGDNFEGTAMPSAAIYEFTNEETKTTILEDISGNKTEKSDLTNVSQFTPYEEEIIKYLESQGSQLTINAGNVDKRKKELIGMTNDESYNYLLNKLINNCLSLKENLANLYSSGIICSRANGGMNGKYFSSQSGQVYNTYNEFEKYFIDKFTSIGYAVILHKSNKAAENCKIALQNSLLRFILYKTQIDQNIYITHYKYVPAINWEDEHCLTDEGLLEMCGCPKDKAKEYAEYVKNYVEERDKKFENKKKRT